MPYLTNTELQQRTGAQSVDAPGFEITLETGWGASFGSGRRREWVAAQAAVNFWPGFFEQGRILDRVTGARAARRNVAIVATTAGGGFAWRTTPGALGARRYGWARTEQEALDAIAAWVRRRFAFVTFGEGGQA